MSTPEANLKARLTAITAVTAIVETRVWPEKQTQSVTGSAITYRRIGTRRTNSAGGATKTAYARFQVRVSAADYTTAKSLASAVRGDPEAIAGPTGLSGYKDGDGCIWHLMDERDDPGPLKPGQDEFENWGVLQDYGVWYSD